MKLIKCALLVFFFVFFTATFAETRVISQPSELTTVPNDIANYFHNKIGCFILYNATEKEIVEKYNPARCATRISPNSTFKIPLSVMVLDQHIVSSDTLFKWDGHKKGMQQWDHNQTLNTWLKYSVVWISQELTPKLGIAKIKKYLNDFNYGNQDFSGTPGKDNGLTNAWLSNSLKISADEQLIFLKNITARNLSVSKKSIAITEKNMFLQKFSNGWRLYGKTGSGYNSNKMIEGWFIGYLKKGKQTYVFVTNFTSLSKSNITDYGGLIAKDITLNILHEPQFRVYK